MPENLEDKLDDFELMLKGFCSYAECVNEVFRTRLLSYWYSLKAEIKGDDK